MAPLLVVMAGLPGVGKSTLARAVALRIGAIWLRVDLIEASLLRAGILQSFETGLAAYITACDLAAVHLRLGHSVVGDAVNGVEPGRAMWRDVAKGTGSDLIFIEAACSDRDEHRRRVESRHEPTLSLRPPTWEEVLHTEYEPWSEKVLTIDTRDPIDVCVGTILGHLKQYRESRFSKPGAAGRTHRIRKAE